MTTNRINRTDIEFDAEGVTLRGWLYRPEGEGPFPAVVMAHGFSAVKEMYLDDYAEAFASAGLACVVYDHRNFGASDGSPRQELDPVRQVRDYRHAITFAESVTSIDPQRIGVWGSSFSGGHVQVVAATDRRVKAVVSQVPAISGHRAIRAMVRNDQLAVQREAFDEDRRARFGGAAPTLVPVVDRDPMAPSALPSSDSYEWFTAAAERAPSWKNEVTLRSIEMVTEYEPAVYMPWISPTPLLMLISPTDSLIPPAHQFEAYEAALEPKELVILDGGHFDAYTTEFARSSAAASEFFTRHLAT